MQAHLPASRFYRPELDIVRFIAFLLVFLHHTLPPGSDVRIDHLLGGFTPAYNAFSWACGFGLSLFFTLSAFLICELLLREGRAVGTIGVKQFYIRRILRIWPLYYFALALGVFVALLSGASHGQLARIGWFAIFLGAWNVTLHGYLNNPIVPLWSISVEEQFYLVAPWVVKYFNRKLLGLFCLLLIIVANIRLFSLGAAGVDEHFVWYNSFVQFECFAAGILLCLVLSGRLPRINLWQRLTLLACSWSCWFLACYKLHCRFVHGYENPGSWHLIGGYGLGALGSVLLIAAFLGIDPKRAPRWAIYLGRISFGLYVYHEFALYISNQFPIDIFLMHAIPAYPLRVCLNVAWTLGFPLCLTFLMAALSYRYFETPLLRLKRRFSVIESQPVTVGDPTLSTKPDCPPSRPQQSVENIRLAS
jgi:peptidoglycan/LPS O-acetylase OafA/YrhL